MHAHADPHDPEPQQDQHVLLRGVTWADYLRLLDIRGEAPLPRMAYVEGTLHLMSPSRFHERIATMLGRLLELYALERDIPLYGFGSWTVRREDVLRGVEPDKCYLIGRADDDRPDLAIEVVHTAGGSDKLPIYAALGVPEVWIWAHGDLCLHLLEDSAYVEAPRSRLLPDVDPVDLASLAGRPDQHEALKAWRERLRQG